MGIVRTRLAALGLGAIALTGCAYMGTPGSTRADAAKALGMAPSDVVIMSLAYDETGPKAEDFALANYTVKTRSGATYVCNMPASAKQDGAEPALVCKPDR